MRDQTKRLYDSEDAACKASGRFRTIEDAVRYASCVTNRTAVRRLLEGIGKISFFRKDGEYSYSQYGTGGMSRITLNKHGMCTQVLIHELAHLIVSRHYKKAVDHGPEFAGVYLWLTGLMNKRRGRILIAGYAAYKVKLIPFFGEIL